MTMRNSSFAPASAATLEVAKPSPSVGRARLNRVMRAIECKSKMILIALSIGVLGLTTTVSAAEPSLQQQLEMLQRQLEQQQRMIQEMQRQLDEQKTANEQRQREEQQIRQQATEAERIAQEAEREGEEPVRAVGIDLSRETDRFGDSKGTHLKIPETDTTLTISGFIRGSAIHDFDKIASPTKFVTRDIVVNGQPSGQPDNRTTFTANASRFILGSSTPTERSKLSTFFPGTSTATRRHPVQT